MGIYENLWIFPLKAEIKHHTVFLYCMCRLHKNQKNHNPEILWNCDDWEIA